MNRVQEEAELATRGGGGGGGGGEGPFQQAILLHFAGGNPGPGVNEVDGTVAVPAGLNLVIETVTADVGVGQQEQAFLFVQTVVRGVTAMHTLVLSELSRTSGWAENVFQATHDVRLYADAGTTVDVKVTRFGNGPYLDMSKPSLITLSGRLESQGEED